MALIQHIARIQFDFGALATLPGELDWLGVHRPLLVTDPGIAACGILDRVIATIAARHPVVFAEAPRHPALPAVEHALLLYRSGTCDGIVALGGGAAIDLAKAVALLATHPAPLGQYSVEQGGSHRITARVAPLVSIPTTAGTGSEIGRGAGVALEEHGVKHTFISVHLVPRSAICDPELTLSLPPAMTAGTGIDALSHCLEGYLSPAVNPPVDAIALDAIERIARHLDTAVTHGSDREARWQLLMGALEGGMCMWKGLGPAHALSIPLDTLDLHHGTLVGVVLPHAVRFVAPAVPAKIARLARALGATDAADGLAELNRRIGLPAGLAAMGVTEAVLPRIAAEAAVSFFNASSARKGTTEDYLALLRAAM
ncbi:MAG: iron-containing alcohol dehydrogenase [Burkholderiales bacterium]